MTCPDMVEAPEVARKDVGVLVHGRDLNAPGLELMLWGFGTIGLGGIGSGDVNDRMGTIPTAVTAMLDVGPENIRALRIGSGASSHIGPDGKLEIEADYMKRQMTDFEMLERFPQISQHPNWQNEENRGTLEDLITAADTDTKAKNTMEEIANAAKFFGALSIARVIQVTSLSHGVRCLMDRDRDRAQVGHMDGQERIIPIHQRWSLVTDGEPYPFEYLVEPVIVEAPHRGNVMAGLPERFWLAQLVKDSYKLPLKDQFHLALHMRRFIDMKLSEAADEDASDVRVKMWLPDGVTDQRH